MRIRRLFASAVLVGGLVGGLVVAMPGIAYASEAGELTECLEKAAEKPTESEINAAAKDCYSAPNLVTPAIGELLWGAAAFFIVLTVLVKFAFPALKKGMAAREDRIRGDLERAESLRAEAETQLTEYQRQLAEARVEAGHIIEEARQAADQVRQDLLARAESDAADARTRAQEDIRLATQRATADLQGRVADLSIELAEKVVEKNLDRATQIQLIENYINQVGSK
ncbi:MAG: F0F1 ATP synthase subunit B [Acidimicrobiia bacterium]